MGQLEICMVHWREGVMTVSCYDFRIYCQSYNNTLLIPGEKFCVFTGDPAYPLRIQLQAPFRNPVRQLEKDFNSMMSKVRVSVEWLFGNISSWFAFLDFKKNLKLNLSAVGKMYLVCALLTNARTCVYGNMTSHFFDCEPPSLEDCFN